MLYTSRWQDFWKQLPELLLDASILAFVIAMCWQLDLFNDHQGFP